MRIALLGATGAVGRLLLEKMLAAGYDVSALVRNPAKLEEHPNLSMIKGDATHLDDLRILMEGADVVVSCLGNVKGKDGWKESNLIMEKAANAILEAASEQSQPPKCIFISTIGCGGTSWLVKKILALIVGRAGIEDYERADARISSENKIPYVLVRPAALNDKPGKGVYRVFKGDGTFVRPIPRADVALFLFDAIGCDDWNGKGGVQLAGAKKA